MTQALLDAKAKPLGSLGRPEASAVQLATMSPTPTPTPVVHPVVLMDGDVAGPVPDSAINQRIVPGTAGWRHGSVNYYR